jgi:hypothetical protein
MTQDLYSNQNKIWFETFEQWTIPPETGFDADFLGIRIQDPADRTGLK